MFLLLIVVMNIMTILIMLKLTYILTHPEGVEFVAYNNPFNIMFLSNYLFLDYDISLQIF